MLVTNGMKNKSLFCLLLFSFCLLFLSSCRLYNLERKLDPEEQDWLSQVRYTVTSEERKIFLELPPSEREKFKEEFWKKRDPDPSTEENEFKIEYYKRIDYANKYLSGGGKPGYLQDRGRIFILFGPPTERSRYPGSEPPFEIWYYGRFPITFVDRFYNGNYRLVATNLAVLNEINTALANVRKGQKRQIEQSEEGKAFFDINLKIEKDSKKEPFLSVEIPYRKIWFAAKEDILETTLVLFMEIFDSNQEKIWQYQKDFLISLTERELEEKMDKAYQIKIPLKLEKDSYSLLLEITNKTGEEKLKKSLSFTI